MSSILPGGGSLGLRSNATSFLTTRGSSFSSLLAVSLYVTSGDRATPLRSGGVGGADFHENLARQYARLPERAGGGPTEPRAGQGNTLCIRSRRAESGSAFGPEQPSRIPPGCPTEEDSRLVQAVAHGDRQGFYIVRFRQESNPLVSDSVQPQNFLAVAAGKNCLQIGSRPL
jgi:hypothetical protein